MEIGVKVGEDRIDLGMRSVVYRDDLKPYAIGLPRCIGEEYDLLGKTGIPVFLYDKYGEEKPIEHPKQEPPKISSRCIQLEEKVPEKVMNKGALPSIIPHARERDKSNLQSLRSYILDIERRMSEGDLEGIERRMIVFPLLFKGMLETILGDEKLIRELYNYCELISEDRGYLQNPEISKNISSMLETMRKIVEETLMRL